MPPGSHRIAVVIPPGSDVLFRHEMLTLIVMCGRWGPCALFACAFLVKEIRCSVFGG